MKQSLTICSSLGDRYKELYSNFVSSREEGSSEDHEGRKHRSRYVNRDNPNQGITVYVKGTGLSENLLKQPLSNYGSILNLIVEEEKKYVSFHSLLFFYIFSFVLLYFFFCSCIFFLLLYTFSLLFFYILFFLFFSLFLYFLLLSSQTNLTFNCSKK